jgi:hypothetical protein
MAAVGGDMAEDDWNDSGEKALSEKLLDVTADERRWARISGPFYADFSL